MKARRQASIEKFLAMRKIGALTVALALAIGYSATANGVTLASGSLDLLGMSATPSAGVLTWSGTWSFFVFASANNSNGDLDSQFGVNSVSTSVSVSVLYASANSLAVALSASSATGHVDGVVSLPGGFDAAANVNPSQSTLETADFNLSAAALVTFGADISSKLIAIADASGMVLHSDSIFNLIVDGRPVLSFSDLISANSSQSASSIQSPALSSSIDLMAGTHTLFIELDTGQQALTSAVPDHAGTGRLFLIPLGCLLVAARLRARSALLR